MLGGDLAGQIDDLGRRRRAPGLLELLDRLGGPLDSDRQVIPADRVIRVRPGAHLDEARRREGELLVRGQDLERRDAGSPVVHVVVVTGDREDLEVGEQHQLPVGADRQHPGLVVGRRDVAAVVEARHVLDAQPVHEVSPTQLGAALVGK